MRRLALPTRRPREGFTLLELIVVITIIGLLGTLVVTRVIPILTNANKTKINHDLRAIYDAAQSYYFANGQQWPESLEQLMSGVDEEGNETIGIEEAKDPWGNPYEYDFQDGKPVIRCYGRDQQPGGTGDDADYEYPKTEGLGY